MAAGVNEPADVHVGDGSDGHVDGASGSGDALDELIHRADLDGLVRLVDAHCASGDWAGLLRLRNAARFAVTTGRQLWPAATLAEYRLALWAPTEWAVQVLDEDSGRFTIGPLTEVIAAHHTFESIAAAVSNGPAAAPSPGGPRLGFVAHERALRGEQIDVMLFDRLGVPDVLELPLAVQPWEPAYRLAVYTDDGVAADPPPRPPAGRAATDADADASIDGGDQRPTGESPTRQLQDRRPAQPVDDPAVDLAVRQLLDPWTASSDGRAEVICVEGTAADAVAAMGVAHASLVSLSPADALSWLAWAGSVGGAHGRRRGAAIGRFGAWWLLAALGDALDEWPLAPDEMGELARELQWFWWDGGEPALGWELQLAVADPQSGYAWAISAHDAA